MSQSQYWAEYSVQHVHISDALQQFKTFFPFCLFLLYIHKLLSFFLINAMRYCINEYMIEFQCSYSVRAVLLCALIFASVCVYLLVFWCIVSFHLISIWCKQSHLLMFLFIFVWCHWLINNDHLYEIFLYSIGKSNGSYSSYFIICVAPCCNIAHYLQINLLRTSAVRAIALILWLFQKN